MLNVLINFSTLKKGGGLNVSMNFLHAFQNVPCPFNLYFMVADGSPQLELLTRMGNQNFVVVPANPIKRILWESLLGWRWLQRHQIDLVYSYFGYAFFLGKVKQVTGSADSNLYFPEIDFWQGYRGLQRLKKSLVDAYRLYCVKKADGVVYENEAMLLRAQKLFGLSRVVYIKPSIKMLSHQQGSRKFEFGSGLVALFLCDWHTNKNVVLIPELLKTAADRGFELKIAISAKFDGSALSNDVAKRVVELGVSDRLYTLGAIEKENLANLYNKVDAVMLLSKLESFSNNIIEAWAYNRPLVVADEEWSRALCDQAALYVARNDPEQIVDTLMTLSNNAELKQALSQQAQFELHSYPTVEQRIEQEYKFLLEVMQ